MKIKKRIKELIQRVRRKNSRGVQEVKEISYNKLKILLKENVDITIVDVRSPQEFAEGRIKFAINIPLYELDKNAESLLPNKESLIIVYCSCGARSKKAYEILEKKGYYNIYSLKGGLDSTF